MEQIIEEEKINGRNTYKLIQQPFVKWHDKVFLLSEKFCLTYDEIWTIIEIMYRQLFKKGRDNYYIGTLVVNEEWPFSKSLMVNNEQQFNLIALALKHEFILMIEGCQSTFS